MKNIHPLAIAVNDLHIGPRTIQEFKDNWFEAVDVAVSNKIDTMLVGGDVFLSRSSQSLAILLTVQECINYANENNIHIIATNGNHDKVNQEDTRGYCHVFSGMENYTVVDIHKVLLFDDVAIHMMPYFPETGSFKKRLKDVALVPEKKNILYIHQGINGALKHSDLLINKELPTHIFDRFDTTLVAHYHNRTRIDGTNIFYIGSSRQHNFGEDTDKGYVIINSDGSFEYVQNKANVKYYTFEENWDNVNKAFFASIKEFKDEGHMVRVIINCTAAQRKHITKKDFVDAGAAKVEIRADAVIVSESSNSGEMRFNKEGLKVGYIAFCEDKGIEDVEFGLKFINKINM